MKRKQKCKPNNMNLVPLMSKMQPLSLFALLVLATGFVYCHNQYLHYNAILSFIQPSPTYKKDLIL